MSGGNPLYWIDPFGLEAATATAIGTGVASGAITVNPITLILGGWAIPSPLADGTCPLGGCNDFVIQINEDASDSADSKQCPENPKARQKKDRFKTGDNAQDQYEEIEAAQRKYRQGKSNQIIDNIDKSKQRDRDSLRPENWDDWRSLLDD